MSFSNLYGSISSMIKFLDTTTYTTYDHRAHFLIHWKQSTRCGWLGAREVAF